MRTRRAPSCAGAAGLYHDDRFVTADSFGDAREPAWISERFQIKQNHPNAWVFFPVLEQIVAGDIGLIADADEACKAQPALSRQRDDGQAKGAALRAESNVALRWKVRSERRIQTEPVDRC